MQPETWPGEVCLLSLPTHYPIIVIRSETGPTSQQRRVRVVERKSKAMLIAPFRDSRGLVRYSPVSGYSKIKFRKQRLPFNAAGIATTLSTPPSSHFYLRAQSVPVSNGAIIQNEPSRPRFRLSRGEILPRRRCASRLLIKPSHGRSQVFTALTPTTIKSPSERGTVMNDPRQRSPSVLHTYACP